MDTVVQLCHVCWSIPLRSVSYKNCYHEDDKAICSLIRSSFRFVVDAKYVKPDQLCWGIASEASCLGFDALKIIWAFDKLLGSFVPVQYMNTLCRWLSWGIDSYPWISLTTMALSSKPVSLPNRRNHCGEQYPLDHLFYYRIMPYSIYTAVPGITFFTPHDTFPDFPLHWSSQL